MNKKQNKRLLAIFSLAILILGVFGFYRPTGKRVKLKDGKYKKCDGQLGILK